MRKSKNHYFYHIFLFPGDAVGAVTLNVVWMEREFDAYKLSRCMCPSNYNRLWESEIFMKKSSFYHTPLHLMPPLGGSRRNIGTPFGMEKLEWCRYPMVKKIRRYVYSFWRDPQTWQKDRRTLHDSKDRACIADRAVKTAPKLLNGTSLNDLEWFLTHISTSQHYSTSNNSKMV